MSIEIQTLGQSLRVGDSERFHCPFCKAEHEKSLAITRTPAGLLYICFRAKCSRQGIVADIRVEPIRTKVFIPQVVTHELVTLPEEVFFKYLMQYGLIYKDWSEYHGVKYAPDINALYLPIYNPWGALIGAQLKMLDWVGKRTKTIPKVLTFKYLEEPLVHFPLDALNNYDELVVVEDYISATLVHELATVCAINGTYITPSMLQLFKIIEVRKLVLMLDGDAIMKAVKLKETIGPLFEECEIVPIPKGLDPKDLPFRQLENLLT